MGCPYEALLGAHIPYRTSNGVNTETLLVSAADHDSNMQQRSCCVPLPWPAERDAVRVFPCFDHQYEVLRTWYHLN